MSFQELINASTMFLLPGLGVDIEKLDRHGFISAFIDDKNHDVKYDRSVFLLFKPNELENLQYFIAKEYKRKDSCLKEDYDYDGGYVVMAYSFPIEFQIDYQRFLMGEYSKISLKYQKLFPQKVTVKRDDGKLENTYNLAVHIFEKSSSLRKYLSKKVYGENDEHEPLGLIDPESELWSCPDLLNKDLLDINLIRGDLVTK
jgi:hypothetical protein